MTMNFLTWYIPVTVVATLWSLANFPCQVSAEAECAEYTADKITASKVKFHRYSVVIHAGSVDSRIHVYRWKNEDSSSLLPEFVHISCCRLTPGIQTLDSNEDINNHVKELLKAAKGYVPDSACHTTPIYFMGTGGMRLLEDSKATDMTEMIAQLFETKGDNPFVYSDLDNIRILSGEEEGMFQWITANYLNGIFPKEIDENDKDETNTVKTHGILGLEDTSTQIAFTPEKGNILANKYPAKVAGKKYSLYVNSYLAYGISEVEEWVRRKVYSEAQTSADSHNTLDDPCLLKGYSIEATIDEKSLTFEGKGDPKKCSDLLEQLIYKPTEPWQCSPSPCAIGTTYQPTITKALQFYVMGKFLNPLKSMKVLKSDSKFSLTDLKNSAKKFCSTKSEEQAKKVNSTEENVSRDCLTGLYLIILLEKGYGFDPDTAQLMAVVKPDQEAIDWSVGAVIYEYERQRCDVEGSLAHSH